MTQPGQILGGKFQVLRTLGEGGMGVVYEVLHVITRHRRALKVLRAGVGDEQERARLLREASAAGRIGNAHITETYDAGSFENGETYVLMEMLEGESLASVLKARRRLPVNEAVHLIMQACDGLGAAHAADVIHRDIKPANLFLTYPKGKEGPPFVKILDFGVSKFDGGANEQLTELTGDGMMLGTLAYMPPEQLEGSKLVDARADVYSLAVTLYTMVAGKRPFAGGSSMASLAVSILAGQSTPIRNYRPNLPDGFVNAIARAMHPNPAQRTQSAKEFAAELQPFLDWESPRESLDGGPMSEGDGGHFTSSESGGSAGSLAPNSGYSDSGNSLGGASNSGDRAVPSVVGHAQALQAAARRSMTDEVAPPTTAYPSLVNALESASGASSPSSSSLSAAASSVPMPPSSSTGGAGKNKTKTATLAIGAVVAVMAIGAGLAVATRPDAADATTAPAQTPSATSTPQATSAAAPTATATTTTSATATATTEPTASAEPAASAKPATATATAAATGAKRPPTTATAVTTAAPATPGKPPLRRDNPY